MSPMSIDAITKQEPPGPPPIVALLSLSLENSGLMLENNTWRQASYPILHSSARDTYLVLLSFMDTYWEKTGVEKGRQAGIVTHFNTVQKIC